MRVTRRAQDTTGASKVRDLMSHSVVAGDARQTLVEAAAEMRAHRVSALAVLDAAGAITGIITERDLMRAIADGRTPGTVHVSQYMTHSPRTVEASDAGAHAAAVMIRHRIRHLPVTDHGKLVGFLSARDLLAMQPWPRELPAREAW